jgi:heat shock protein HslJ
MRIVKIVLSFILGISLAGCSMNVVDPLAGTSWVLDSWANDTMSPAAYGITLEFGHDGGTNGKSSVNQYGSAYQVKKDSALVFSNTQSTAMASTDAERNLAESIFFKYLNEVKFYEITGENLILKDKDHASILMFHKVAFPASGK